MTACCRRSIGRDRDDTPRFSWYLHWKLPEPRLEAGSQKSDQWRNLVRSYLACTSFVDAQVGRMLEALDEAGLADNTIVVLWGDHGWHLGEKLITGKNTLWDGSTRVPLIFAGPGITAAGAASSRPNCSISIPHWSNCADCRRATTWKGISLQPQLEAASTPRERPAITSHNQGNHGIRTLRWRYIRYADGSEELYDLDSDPMEWKNLAGDARQSEILAEHRRWLPAVDVSPAAGSAHRVLTYDSKSDEAIWEGKKIRRSDPIPE